MAITQLFSNLAAYHNLEYEFSERIDALYSLEFEETGIQIKQILESVYRDGITGLENVVTKDGKVTGIFLDFVKTGLTKRFKFEITENEITYEPEDPNTMDFTEVDFATVAKEKKCAKGMSCGRSCVPFKQKNGKATICRQNTPTGVKSIVKEVIAKVTKAPAKTKPKADKPGKKDLKSTSGSSTTNPNFAVSTDNKQLKKLVIAWDDDITKIKKVGAFNGLAERIQEMKEDYAIIKNKSAEEYKKANYAQSQEKNLASREILIQSAELEESSLFAEIKGSPFLDVDPDKIDAAAAITSGLHSSAKKGNGKRIGVIDKSGNLQALVNYRLKNDHLYIDELGTAPWNLIGDNKAARGAGTEAIIQAVILSKEMGKGGKIKLFPLENAKPFYEKLGFVDSYGGMTLSPESAENLLNKAGKK